MCLISIIVPVYNVEKYLERCVESILNQSFSDYELILVNDGSLDQSGEICDRYAQSDKRVFVIHKENGGSSSARNRGIDSAQGKYLFFVDADDIIHSKTLEKLLFYIEKFTADMAIGMIKRFSEVEKEELCVDCINCTYEVMEGKEVLKYLYQKEISYRYTSACGRLIKRELFEKIRFPEGKLFEDEAITYLLYLKSKKIVLVEQPLYYYFINNNGNMGTLTLEKKLDQYDSQWERIVFYKENKLRELFEISLLYYLDTARWDLILARSGNQSITEKKRIKFEEQYKEVFQLAYSEKILDFMSDYDYFVLGNPKRVWLYRLKRVFFIKKNKWLHMKKGK